MSSRDLSDSGIREPLDPQLVAFWHSDIFPSSPPSRENEGEVEEDDRDLETILAAVMPRPRWFPVFGIGMQ